MAEKERRTEQKKQQNKYHLRKASLEDAFCLFEWKNDLENLKNSHNHTPVLWEDHVKWLKAVMEDKNRSLWILEEDGKPAGQLRLDLSLDKAEISYGIDPLCRGRGLGKKLLLLAEDIAMESGIELLYGEVLFHNQASRSLFQKLGYREKKENGFYSYKKAVNTVFIRTDMNEVIATGHLMRCLSIADAAAKHGKKVYFISADENPKELVCERGHRFLCLNTRWDCMDKEIEKLTRLIEEYGIGKLLIDSYRVTKSYLAAISKKTEVFYLDDLDSFEYPVQNVVCYANYYDKLSYLSYKAPVNLYLGTKYMPLREIYSNQKEKEIREEISTVLLLSGGSDPLNMLDRLLPVLLKKLSPKKIGKIIVICGKLYKDFDLLCKKYERGSSEIEVCFLQNVPNPETYMEEADLAVSAGGTTLYELSAMGVPTITYSFADNQLRNVQQFMEDKLMDYAGDGRKPGVEEEISRYFDLLDRNIELRKTRSKRMQQLIDGKGADRIAELLSE